MKKISLLLVASLALFSACSTSEISADQSPTPMPEKVVFEISAVEKLSLNGTRANLYSQQAQHSVENVNVYVFKLTGVDYLYSHTYTIPWTTGSSFERYEVPTADFTTGGTYKFLGVGRDQVDNFGLTPLTVGTTNYNNMLATVTAAGQETEIFSGSADMIVATGIPGMRVSLQLTRKVAGILGYFLNVPAEMAGVAVRYLRLTVNKTNLSVNLTTGLGSANGAAPYKIYEVDFNGQIPNGQGAYPGNSAALSAVGVSTLPNTQLNGAFSIPVTAATLTLGLYDTDNVALKEWQIMDGVSSTFDLTANNFYALGVKTMTATTDGTGPGVVVPIPDAPLNLMVDQVINVTITPAWSVIHNMVLP